ncbi:MAG: hypothetical protein ABI596_03855 [Pyrinomonadaceae bacterium]
METELREGEGSNPNGVVPTPTFAWIAMGIDATPLGLRWGTSNLDPG